MRSRNPQIVCHDERSVDNDFSRRAFFFTRRRRSTSDAERVCYETRCPNTRYGVHVDETTNACCYCRVFFFFVVGRNKNSKSSISVGIDFAVFTTLSSRYCVISSVPTRSRRSRGRKARVRRTHLTDVTTTFVAPRA